MKFGIWQYVTNMIREANDKNHELENVDDTIVAINFGLKSFDVLNDLLKLEKMT